MEIESEREKGLAEESAVHEPLAGLHIYMSDITDKKTAEITDSIRQILYHDRNTISSSSLPKDEYDSYVAPIYRILVGSRSEKELIECLCRMEHDVVGTPSKSQEHWKSIAQKLLSVDA